MSSILIYNQPSNICLDTSINCSVHAKVYVRKIQLGHSFQKYEI